MGRCDSKMIQEFACSMLILFSRLTFWNNDGESDFISHSQHEIFLRYCKCRKSSAERYLEYSSSSESVAKVSYRFQDESKIYHNTIEESQNCMVETSMRACRNFLFGERLYIH